MGSSPRILSNGEMDAELVEEGSDFEVHMSDPAGNSNSSADDVLYALGYHPEVITSGDDLREAFEFTHDLSTELNGVSEVITVVLSSNEVFSS